MSYLNKELTEAAAATLGLKCLWGQEIKEGDFYLAQRNRPYPVLLTCKINMKDRGFIVCEEIDYCFDQGECVKVLEENSHD